MDTPITYDEVVALVANPPTLAPHPNFTNLRALRHHLQCALQCLVNPQSYVLGWSGLVMSRPMYHLLSTSPFRLPNDPGPQVVYYGARVHILDTSGNPVNYADGNLTYVLIPALDCTTLSYQVMGTWIYIDGFHRRVKVPSVRSILYSTT